MRLKVTIIVHSIKKKPYNFVDAWLFKEMHCKLEQLAIFVSNLNHLHLGCAKAKFEMSRK